MKKLMLSVLAIAAFAFSASAQDVVPTQTNATQSAQNVKIAATLFKPITIANDQTMNFGKLAVGTVDGTVTIAASSTVALNASDNKVALISSSSAQTAAHFTVSGQNDKAYTVYVPQTAKSLKDGVTVGSFVTNLTDNVGSIDANGNSNFYVGATLSYEAAKVDGSDLNSTFDVTVAYN